MALAYNRAMAENDPPDERRPVRLEYFAGKASDEPAPGPVVFWWIVLLLGWLPFACGIINSQAIVRSGVESIIRVHVKTGAALMIVGVVLSASCCVSFAVQRKILAVSASLISLVVQIFLFLCIGGW